MSGRATRASAERFTIDSGRAIGDVFAGWAAGYYTIPDTLERFGRIYLDVQAAAVATNEAQRAYTGLSWEQGLIASLAGEMIRSAAQTGKLEVQAMVEQVVAARAAADRARVAHAITGKAADVIEDAWLLGAFASTVPEFVHDHLSPALAELLTAVRALAPDLADQPIGDGEAMVSAPAASQAAYVALVGLAARHDGIRAAQRAVRVHAGPVGGGPVDGGGLFFDCQAQPAYSPARASAGGLRPAGPAGRLERLYWLATDRAAEPWVPMPGEQDTLFLALSRKIASRRPSVAPSLGGRATYRPSEGSW